VATHQQRFQVTTKARRHDQSFVGYLIGERLSKSIKAATFRDPRCGGNILRSRANRTTKQSLMFDETPEVCNASAAMPMMLRQFVDKLAFAKSLLP
jgi:hypothetical protein